jgi:hypothetical protein
LVADRSARFTDPAELVAYLTVQVAASIWTFTGNAAIVGALVRRGHRDWLWAMLALGIATAAAALILFLFIRWLLAKAGRGQRWGLTDLPEISAYLLAQAIGFILSAFVVSAALSSLYQAGVRNLAVAAIGMYVATILVELLIFLVLRRALTTSDRQGSRGGAAGFGLGLAFAAWVVVALTIGSDRGMFPGTSMIDRLPWLFDVCVAASLAAWAGGSAAYALTGFLQSRPWRAASITILTPCIAGPAAAVLVMGMWYEACAGQVTMGWAIRTGAQRTLHAVTAGGVSFGVACLLVTLLWSFFYLRPSR